MGISELNDEQINEFSDDLQGFSGADIEGVLIDAKRIQKHQKNAESIISIIKRCIEESCPISVTLSEEVKKMREEFTYRRFTNVNNSNYANTLKRKIKNKTKY